MEKITKNNQKTRAQILTALLDFYINSGQPDNDIKTNYYDVCKFSNKRLISFFNSILPCQ